MSPCSRRAIIENRQDLGFFRQYDARRTDGKIHPLFFYNHLVYRRHIHGKTGPAYFLRPAGTAGPNDAQNISQVFAIRLEGTLGVRLKSTLEIIAVAPRESRPRATEESDQAPAPKCSACFMLAPV